MVRELLCMPFPGKEKPTILSSLSREWELKRWQKIEFGSPGTLQYRMIFYDRLKDREVSPLHGIPLYLGDGHLNFLCKTSRESWLRLEIAKNEPFNPLRLAQRNEKPSSYSHNLRWNFGMMPKTWADPNLRNSDDCPFDGLPIEVFEIGARAAKVGDVYPVKPLAAYSVVINKSVTSWKVVAISADDEMVHELRDVQDVRRLFPGALEDISEWLRASYSTPSDGKEIQVTKMVDVESVNRIVAEAHSSWQLIADFQKFEAISHGKPLKPEKYESLWQKYTKKLSKISIPVSAPAESRSSSYASLAEISEDFSEFSNSNYSDNSNLSSPSTLEMSLWSRFRAESSLPNHTKTQNSPTSSNPLSIFATPAPGTEKADELGAEVKKSGKFSFFRKKASSWSISKSRRESRTSQEDASSDESSNMFSVTPYFTSSKSIKLPVHKVVANFTDPDGDISEKSFSPEYGKQQPSLEILKWTDCRRSPGSHTSSRSRSRHYANYCERRKPAESFSCEPPLVTCFFPIGSHRIFQEKTNDASGNSKNSMKKNKGKLQASTSCNHGGILEDSLSIEGMERWKVKEKKKRRESKMDDVYSTLSPRSGNTTPLYEDKFCISESEILIAASNLMRNEASEDHQMTENHHEYDDDASSRLESEVTENVSENLLPENNSEMNNDDYIILHSTSTTATDAVETTDIAHGIVSVEATDIGTSISDGGAAVTNIASLSTVDAHSTIGTGGATITTAVAVPIDAYAITADNPAVVVVAAAPPPAAGGDNVNVDDEIERSHNAEDIEVTESSILENVIQRMESNDGDESERRMKKDGSWSQAGSIVMDSQVLENPESIFPEEEKSESGENVQGIYKDDEDEKLPVIPLTLSASTSFSNRVRKPKANSPRPPNGEISSPIYRGPKHLCRSNSVGNVTADDLAFQIDRLTEREAAKAANSMPKSILKWSSRCAIKPESESPSHSAGSNSSSSITKESCTNEVWKDSGTSCQAASQSWRSEHSTLIHRTVSNPDYLLCSQDFNENELCLEELYYKAKNQKEGRRRKVLFNENVLVKTFDADADWRVPLSERRSHAAKCDASNFSISPLQSPPKVSKKNNAVRNQIVMESYHLLTTAERSRDLVADAKECTAGAPSGANASWNKDLFIDINFDASDDDHIETCTPIDEGFTADLHSFEHANEYDDVAICTPIEMDCHGNYDYSSLISA